VEAVANMVAIKSGKIDLLSVAFPDISKLL
jgi:hypothetical protein